MHSTLETEIAMSDYLSPPANECLPPAPGNCFERTGDTPQSVSQDVARSLRNRILSIAVGTLILASATDSRSGQPDNVTAAEMALLPKYCADAQSFGYGDAYTNTSPNAPKWVALMGKGFWAIHHYCWALVNLSRVQKPSMPATVRQFQREYAIDDMKYVIHNTGPDFVMLPEIYTKMGEVYLSLKRPVEAREVFAKARSLKPDYWPPYYHWADHLNRTGQKTEARETVEEGLSYSPGAKPLQMLLTTLGGDPASIRPRPPSGAAGDSTKTTGPAK